MKFLPLIGMVAAALMATTVALQAATVNPTEELAPALVTHLADNKPATFGDAKVGQSKAAACAACHGLDGNSVIAQFPKLAGQHERYIWRQLKLFKSGERSNPIMLGMAAALPEQDMRDIGAYFATQKIVAGVADDTVITSGPNQGRKFYQVGERLYRMGKPETGIPACLACHGPSGRGNPGSAYPALAGQHASYAVAKLQAFRNNEVWGKEGNASTVMTVVARNLSDEEIQSLATYIQGLHDVAASATAKIE